MSKQYGLLIPNKNKPSSTLVQKPSIFEDDSDSNDEPSKPTGLKTSIKRQDRVLQEKAVEEDPTVFQYDEVYDEMDKKRTESKLSRKDLDKKPKYISKLLQSAERRKRENERRIERQVQKEREAEGEMFKDKESFVTSAYRKKLEELRKLEEQEKREEYLEAIGDVTKQGNLDGFYRHLYDQKVLYEERVKESMHENQNSNKESTINTEQADIKQEVVSEQSANDSEDDEKLKTEKKKQRNIRKRKYRKRDESESDENIEHEEEKKLEHLPSNIDADSDFSIDSSSSEDEKDSEIKSEQPEVHFEDKIEETEKENEDSSKSIAEDGKESENDIKEDAEAKEKVVEPQEKKPKIDIWKKRTVGTVFEEALKRYYERKAQREAGVFSRF